MDINVYQHRFYCPLCDVEWSDYFYDEANLSIECPSIDHPPRRCYPHVTPHEVTKRDSDTH